MHRTTVRICLLACALLLVSGSAAAAVARDIADLQSAPLTLRQSLIHQLTAGVLADPYDELLRRPYNLGYTNLERYPNLSPWPGQEAEQNRLVDFLLGNNGNSDVRNGADTLQGTYIGRSMEKLTWGVSAAYLADDRQTTNSTVTAAFGDGEMLTGHDLRLAMGYRVSERAVLGGGISTFGRSDEVTDTSQGGGVGAFFSLQELTESGVEIDIGARWFRSDTTSWSARLAAGSGLTEWNDFSDDVDSDGVVVTHVVNREYDVGDRHAELSGGYNRRYLDGQGEMQLEVGVRLSSSELDNSLLAYRVAGGATEPSLELLEQDPISESALFASAGTLFLRGWTQIFASARLSASRLDGSTTADSMGTPVSESIDDTRNSLALVLGLRQPLWNERFRLVARARGDWVDTGEKTINDGTSTTTDRTQTTTAFAVGIETVLNNMVFDLAWLFGGEPAPGGASEPTRQTVDLNRLVLSATFGW